MNSKSLKYYLVILSCLICSCASNTDTKIAPRAIKGVIDLSNWDFDRDGPVDLVGEYSFYWKELLHPRDFPSGSTPEKSGFIILPGFWKSFNNDKTLTLAEGFASYRLKIVLNPNNRDRSLAIKYLDMGTAFNLYLNGKSICSAGTVGKNSITSHPKYHPGVTDFRYSGATLDLILQVSNFHHRRGGAWNKLTLGTVADLHSRRAKHINYDVFLFGSILIMAIYHLGLFFLRRKEKAPLFFGAFSLLVALRILTTGEIYIMEILPTISWQLLAKLEYLSFYLAVPAFGQFVYHLFPKHFSKKICTLASIAGILFAMVVIISPVSLFSQTLPAYQIFTLVVLFYSLCVLILASAKKEFEAIIFLSGFLLIFLTAINDILNTENIIQTGNFISLGLFLFIFSQAFLQSLRFSRAFALVDSQRKDLKNEISDRLETEKELKASHKRFLNVLDSINADVYVADMQTYKILFMNQNMIESFKEDYTGQICWEVFRKGTEPCPHCTNDKLLNAAGKPAGVQIWECHNPITDRWYINYDRAIYWDHGRIVRLQVATDVTQRILAEEALQKANTDLETRVTERTADLVHANESLRREIEDRKHAQESTRKAKSEAERANQAKSEFLANMSHELRTPLNHILGFTELVIDGHVGDLNETQQEYLNDVHQSSSHLLSLINDILDISKVEAGKLELKSSTVELRVLLENSMVMVKEKAIKNGIKLSNKINGIPETIMADERKLKQVQYNLLSNAVKFTSKGGQVNLSARVADIGKEMGFEASGIDTKNLNWIHICVTDTGIGLSKDDLDRIFNPFEQVEHSKSRKYQGTGLGLSLTKTLVEIHGGKIWAESDGEGKGSRFHYILPLVSG